MTLRDETLLQHIVLYCGRIQLYLQRCQQDREAFLSDPMIQDACCMCIVQIGELSGLLSDDLKKENQNLPWRAIKDTRNFYVHNYGNVNFEYVWNTMLEDLPALEQWCKSILERKE